MRFVRCYFIGVVTLIAAVGSLALFRSAASAEEWSAPAASLSEFDLQMRFEGFFQERKRRLEAQARPLFESFLDDQPGIFSRTKGAVAHRADFEARSGTSIAPKNDCAGAALQSITGVGGESGGTGRAPTDIAWLQGEWCSSLVIYEGLRPFQWNLVSPARVRITYPVLVGDRRGMLRTKDARIEPLADGTLRLVEDNSSTFTETVYGIERRYLSGNYYRRVDKRSLVEKTGVPDSLRRCDGRE
jgi:hypothetical protein